VGRAVESGLRAQAVVLEAATIGLAGIEAVAGLLLGLAGGSPSLVGLGLESVVKVAAALVVIWQVRGPQLRARERPALCALALAFFAIAVLVGADAVHRLTAALPTVREPPALLAAAAGMLVAPPLARAKLRLADRARLPVVRASGIKTEFYATLCAVTLAAVVVTQTLGW
jgi:divalent metal cation (Fe/Co/Zn/Cd) transporter